MTRQLGLYSVDPALRLDARRVLGRPSPPTRLVLSLHSPLFAPRNTFARVGHRLALISSPHLRLQQPLLPRFLQLNRFAPLPLHSARYSSTFHRPPVLSSRHESRMRMNEHQPRGAVLRKAPSSLPHLPPPQKADSQRSSNLKRTKESARNTSVAHFFSSERAVKIGTQGSRGAEGRCTISVRYDRGSSRRRCFAQEQLSSRGRIDESRIQARGRSTLALSVAKRGQIEASSPGEGVKDSLTRYKLNRVEQPE